MGEERGSNRFALGLQVLLRYQSQFGKTMKDFKTFTETNKDFRQEIEKLAQVGHFSRVGVPSGQLAVILLSG